MPLDNLQGYTFRHDVRNDRNLVTFMAKKSPSLSPVKQNADAMLKGKNKYKSGSRPARNKATKAEMERATYIIERADKMKMAKGIYSNAWREYEKTWKMVEDTRPEDEKWRANLPDTFAYAAVKTAQAAFIDSEVVPVFAKNQDDDLRRANDMRDLYTDISKKGDQKFQLYLARLDAFKLGTGFLFTYFEKDTRITWEIDSFDPESDKITYTRKVVDHFSDPKSIRVSPYLVLIDEACRADFRATARDAILIEIISREEAKIKYGHLFGGPEAFEERVPQTSTMNGVGSATLTNTGVATTATDNRGDAKVKTYNFFAPIELSDDLVEVLHYFCVRPEDSKEMLINGAPAEVKTENWPTPLPWIHKEIPLTPLRYSLYSGDEFWGQGIIEVSRADSKAHREHREMMSDRQRLSLFAPVFSDVNDEIDQKLLKLKPLSIIRTRGGVPKQFQLRGLTSADLEITASYEKSLKRATGIDENVVAGGAEGLAAHRYTATAIQFMRQAAFLRLKDFQFLYKMALLDEIRLKLKLFEQYYSSPMKQTPHLTEEKGLQELSAKIKMFNVKVGNTYSKKKVSSTLFTGAIEDIDLDMQALVPMSPAELITKWSQVIRDVTPFVQAGITDLDMEKILKEYMQALEVNMDKFRKSPDDEAITMADGEHSLLLNKNTSQVSFEKMLKEATPARYLTAMHLKRHQQLLQNEEEIGKDEMRNLISHIKADTDAYEKLMMEQAQGQGANMDKFANSPMLGQMGAPDSGISAVKPPSLSMSYKDAPDDVKRQIEKAAGLDPSEAPEANANETGDKKPPRIDTSRVGKSKERDESQPLIS